MHSKQIHFRSSPMKRLDIWNFLIYPKNSCSKKKFRHYPLGATANEGVTANIYKNVLSKFKTLGSKTAAQKQIVTAY